VPWSADFHDDFVAEYNALPEEVQDELQAILKILEQLGPLLGRPRVDTLNGSAHANMKEIRFDAADGVLRLRSTRTANPSFSRAATSPASVKSGSTDSSSPRRTRALQHIRPN
jgi:Phage derived protein Gp49-like (DUF891)